MQLVRGVMQAVTASAQPMSLPPMVTVTRSVSASRAPSCWERRSLVVAPEQASKARSAPRPSARSCG
jgi:hypothetical protein